MTMTPAERYALKKDLSQLIAIASDRADEASGTTIADLWIAVRVVASALQLLVLEMETPHP